MVLWVNCSFASGRAIFPVAVVRQGRGGRLVVIRFCLCNSKARLGTVMGRFVHGKDLGRRARGSWFWYIVVENGSFAPLVQGGIPTSKYAVSAFGTVPSDIFVSIQTWPMTLVAEIVIESFISAVVNGSLRASRQFLVLGDDSLTKRSVLFRSPTLVRGFVDLEMGPPGLVTVMTHFFRRRCNVRRAALLSAMRVWVWVWLIGTRNVVSGMTGMTL